MKKRMTALLLITVILLATVGCASESSTDNSATGLSNSTADIEQDAGSKTSKTDIVSSEASTGNILDSLAEIPSEYFQEAEQKGTLEELEYDTFESFSYEEQSQSLTKRAIVYLPYGYSEDVQYDVFYFMHGGWSNETSTLGTPGNENGFKNVLDNAIQNGEIEPLIIVCPTYNNTNENGQDSDSFSLAMQLTENYHNELINDLLPAVEGTYSTYAEDVTAKGLADARDHRGFGGFSMGSVTTWRTFEYCMDYFRYYLPMSYGTSLDDEEIWQGANGYDQEDYFVWMITGTKDFAYSYDENRANEMRDSEYFTEAGSLENGNFAYTVKEGYSHDGTAAMEYTYNGLRLFWGAEAGNTAIERGGL